MVDADCAAESSFAEDARDVREQLESNVAASKRIVEACFMT